MTVTDYKGNIRIVKPNATIIALDFDGCVVYDKYPEIGEPIQETLDMVYYELEKGSRFILWTCRCGKYLVAAVDFCENKLGIAFEQINRNVQDRIDKYGSDCRKVFADVYIDDKAVRMGQLYCCPIFIPNEIRKGENYGYC